MLWSGILAATGPAVLKGGGGFRRGKDYSMATNSHY